MERIFISGLGFATCLGSDRETFWKNLTAGVCGIDTLEVHDTTDLPVNIGGEIREIDKSRINVNDLVSTKKMDRASQFAVLAAHEALEDAVRRIGVGFRTAGQARLVCCCGRVEDGRRTGGWQAGGGRLARRRMAGGRGRLTSRRMADGWQTDGRRVPGGWRIVGHVD